MVPYHKTSRLYFNKYLTKNKKVELGVIFAERVKILSFLEHALSVELIIPNISCLMRTEGLFGLQLDTLYGEYRTSGGVLTKPMFYLVVREYVKAVKHNINLYGKDNYRKPVFKANQFIFDITGLCSAYDTSRSYIFQEVSNMKAFDMCLEILDYKEVGINDIYTLTIPLKKHRQYNKLNADYYLVSKVILTDKYVEVTFEKQVEVYESKHETISISKNGDLRLSDGDRVKFKLKEKMRPNMTKGQTKQLKSQIRKRIEESMDFNNLHTLTLDYRAVGQNYSECSLCKSVIKALCKSNRVNFIDAYSIKKQNKNNQVIARL